MTSPDGGGRSGFSLVEAVVAIAILSVAIVGTQTAIRTATLNSAEVSDRFLAQQVAANRAAELALVGAALGRALPAEVTFGGRTWSISVREDAALGGVVKATIDVQSESGAGASLVSYITVEP